MKKSDEIYNLNQIWQALSFLDLKGTNETVTMAMTIVSIAKDLIQRGEPVEASILLRYAQNISEEGCKTGTLILNH